MIKIERTSVMNFENAMRGARNPLNSWARSDSFYAEDGSFVFGPNDLDLARRLSRAGTDHRKYLRQIFISVDVTAPLYWWKEFDTYKVGTVSNSTSTMHKIHSKPFELEDFSTDHMTQASVQVFEKYIGYIEEVRQKFVAGKDKTDWYDLIQLLPSSYNQTRTLSFNYETAANIYRSRKDHKLDEWRTFCEWIRTLPYAKDIVTLED